MTESFQNWRVLSYRGCKHNRVAGEWTNLYHDVYSQENMSEYYHFRGDIICQGFKHSKWLLLESSVVNET